MNIQQIIANYDAMFGKHSMAEIENYLYQNITEAKMTGEKEVQLTLLNEMIGFCRDTTQKEKALNYCNELKELLHNLDLGGTVAYATSLLNIANAYRAFGMINESSQLHMQALEIYRKELPANDFRYASLYNNWSLVYQEAVEYMKACEMLQKALEVLKYNNNTEIPQATTRVNIASAMIQIGTDESIAEAEGQLKQALDIFENDGERDFHYSAALVAMGDVCICKGNLNKAAGYYEKGLEQIEKHTGRNTNYYKVLEKLENIKEAIPSFAGNLEKSKTFYETYGRKIIHELFPEYENRIAVGLVGEGSDCFGFDDEISMDHDYSVGFCMWVTDEDYAKIGDQLQMAYDELVKNVYHKKAQDRFINGRRGVIRINDFYNNILRTRCDYEKIKDFNFYSTDEKWIAAAVNGAVFKDDLGVFSKVRNLMTTYYPEELWRRKLAQELHEFSQYAQSNYPRMMARGDQLTANLCICKGAESAMNMVYLLNGIYAPYYKWKRKGLENIQGASAVLRALEEIAVAPSQRGVWINAVYSPVQINTADRVTVLFEEVAKNILDMMKVKGLASGDELFLESHIGEVLGSVNISEIASEPAQPLQETAAAVCYEKESVDEYGDDISPYKEFLIKNVMALEWEQFDKVHNEGGRASCQDDHETFKIMRLSQYMTWSEELLKSFYNDLRNAEERGWNLITEKYARMMKNTDPVQYSRIEAELPVLSEERKKLQEVIIGIQVSWMEKFAAEYPSISGGARSIHSYDDSTYNTSYETYLRGEISTYSDETFMLYAGFIRGALNAGRNISREIMKNTTVLYGYSSLDDAEAKQGGRR